MNNDEQTRRNKFRKSEWFGIVAIFIIAFVTGYFYTTGRLERAEDNQVQAEQTEEVPGTEEVLGTEEIPGDVESEKTP